MSAKHAEMLMKSYMKKNSNKQNKQLAFLKPGQYMSASDNRFVVFKVEEPCLILENTNNVDAGWKDGRYIVLAKNKQLIAIGDNFVNTGETK